MSEEVPVVTQAEWDAAVGIFDITDKGSEVWAVGPGQSVPYSAKVNTWTQGRIVAVFIPSVRQDVLYTITYNGTNSSGMISGNFVWSGDGFDYQSHTISAMKCHVQGYESIGAYSNHFAQWNAVKIGPIPLQKQVGPERYPAGGTVSDGCPAPPEPPPCPSPWTPDGSDCLETIPNSPPPGGGGEGELEPPFPGCIWYEYSYWNWWYGVWLKINTWYVCE